MSANRDDSGDESPPDVLSDELWERYAARVLADEEAAEPWPTPPDYTVMRQSRLVAYIWKRPGALRRAGAETQPLCESPVADVVCFAPKEIELLKVLLTGADSIDALVFDLGVEDLRVTKGPAMPAPHVRQF